MSNIHNRTDKSGILFTDLCKKYFFNWHDLVEDMFCYIGYLFRIYEDLIRIII